ncbi:hypothetical protein ACOME3_004322 [Neoechinorhynchus agilis]
MRLPYVEHLASHKPTSLSHCPEGVLLVRPKKLFSSLSSCIAELILGSRIMNVSSTYLSQGFTRFNLGRRTAKTRKYFFFITTTSGPSVNLKNLINHAAGKSSNISQD